MSTLKKLGPYRLERLLGRGGMGSVYVGVHDETGQYAAIKVLSMTLADDDTFRARFLVEIETLKQLTHPNIVQILGDGEQDGHLFYVMELVDGKSLQEILQSGHAFDWRETTRIAIEICGALKHAHDCGVIHRDLKPANLLRTTDERIKLTDFGIAKLFGATHRTADGSVVGTADYMAPEQADGRPVTNRTDLYSLGAVLFTLLARRTPFQGGTLAQVVHKLKYDEAPAVRRFAPDVPEELESIIKELLSKDPQQRVATALALANRLRAMEHALVARQESLDALDNQITRVAPPESPDVGAGSAAGGDRYAPTMLAPTSVDPGKSQDDRKFSWNEATVVTSASQSQVEKTRSVEPGEPSPGEQPPSQNRFTTIDEDHKRRAGDRTLADDATRNNLTTVVGIIVLLSAIVGVCAWGMWPPSADTLYRRIQTVALEKGPSEAWKDIEQFLQRFPKDSRHSQIDDLRRDVESEWLGSRLRLRKRKTDGLGLEAYEQQWLEAYLLRQKDPQKSLTIWQQLLKDYGEQSTPPESLRTILAAARHELKRMSEVNKEIRGQGDKEIRR